MSDELDIQARNIILHLFYLINRKDLYDVEYTGFANLDDETQKIINEYVYKLRGSQESK